MVTRWVANRCLTLLTKPRWYYFPLALVCLVFYCEFLVYYVTLSFCRWPTNSDDNADHAKVIIIADTHLLGVYKGHWLDKLRREWQMHRAFQTAITLFPPDAVFFLGDLFDEGQWSTKEQFFTYVSRFHSLFAVDDKIQVYSVVGNHDIGFHYVIHPARISWFREGFNSSASVDIVDVRGNIFVLVNSMAMEGDGCQLCRAAEQEIVQIGRSLRCAMNKTADCRNAKSLPVAYSQPILMQHFPLYRENDALCSEPDEAPSKLKMHPNREKWECLSRSSTNLLLDSLRPRAVFTGHTHYGCRTEWPTHSLVEWTVASFSWRNTPQPSFLLLSASPKHLAVSKCLVPNEYTVIAVYIAGVILELWWIVMYCKNCRRRKLRTN
uniref:Calcineurin-like phosphoesterase domain-containing protein n=1 Tax=Plectus sambesii TaxID=2011161 RepID=A0A914VQE3_9BILA